MDGTATAAGPVWDPGEKTHKDENFPVASRLVAKRHRAPIMAFYRFARAADDVADDPALSADEKVARLDAFEATLLGTSDAISDAIPLRSELDRHQLTPRHGQDLLTAFRMDATKLRYETWEDLLAYCDVSANPVGRFVLDVHGESRETWAANDRLCTALQIINHLQDCGHDYRRLNRVYVPEDALTRHGAGVSHLDAPKTSPQLLACIRELTAKTEAHLSGSRLSSEIGDMRLGLEVAAIEGMARKLLSFLKVRDPLSERVHVGKAGALAILVSSAGAEVFRRAFRISRPRRDPVHP